MTGIATVTIGAGARGRSRMLAEKHAQRRKKVDTKMVRTLIMMPIRKPAVEASMERWIGR
jgi:hypothetical protein